jgi:hypothetical protein
MGGCVRKITTIVQLTTGMIFVLSKAKGFKQRGLCCGFRLYAENIQGCPSLQDLLSLSIWDQRKQTYYFPTDDTTITHIGVTPTITSPFTR